MSTRLTNDLRADIVRGVLEFKFAAGEKLLAVEGKKLFETTLDALLDPHKAAIEALPQEWRSETSNLAIVDVASRESFLLSGARRIVPSKFNSRINLIGTVGKKAPRRLVYNYSRYDNNGLTRDLKLPELFEHVLKAFALRAERKELSAKLEALVAGVTTTKKLYEVWPELAEIVPDDWSPKTSAGTAITVSVAELNRAIPLPTKKGK